MARKPLSRAALAAAVAVAGLIAWQPAAAQGVSIAEGVHAGELAVPVNKSQVLRTDRPYAKALIGNPDIADILPLSDRSLYVLGKKTGTTSLTLYDRRSQLIAVLDVAVGPDVITLKRQLSELIPGDDISARMSNDSVDPRRHRVERHRGGPGGAGRRDLCAGQGGQSAALGSAQQVMLEVRFSEIKRSALTQIGRQLGHPQRPWQAPGNHRRRLEPHGGRHDNDHLDRRRRDDDDDQRRRGRAPSWRDHRQLRDHLARVPRARREFQRHPRRARAQGRDHDPRRADPDRFVGRDRKLPRRRRIPGPDRSKRRRRGAGQRQHRDHGRMEAVRRQPRFHSRRCWPTG